ncbi:MAG: 30S ribosomal protein S21 [Deltaproteobacteria bacterium]|nr:30S ribosomal protein S21 [Candidatus Zymogenaceae bacterium]
MEVKVHDNDVEKAIKVLKNKLAKSGFFKEMKERRYYEKPSIKKKRKRAEAKKRALKAMRRRKQDY